MANLFLRMYLGRELTTVIFTIMLRRGYILAAIILCVQQVFGFSPSILTYSTKDYNAHQVNYDAFFDEQGLLYVANAYGILTYDGDSWKKTEMAVSNGWEVRVGQRDDEMFMLTKDWIATRVTLTIVDGKVTQVDVG